MYLAIVKLLILISLFIGTYIFSLLPIPLMRAATTSGTTRRRNRIDRCISFLSCFAAGVFLGTCLLDLYPEVQSKLVGAVEHYISKDSKFRCYPFGESVMVAGFFLVLIVEQVVLAFKEKGAMYELAEVTSNENPSANRNRSSSRSSSRRATYNSINSINSEQGETDRLLGNNTAHEQIPRPRSASITSALSINAISDRLSAPTITDQHDQSMHQDPSSHSPIRSFIMLAALSLHSVFEGLAVGLQDTEAGVLSIFGALILHKCIIAFSIGLNLVQSNLSVRAIIASNALFCLASPIGIGLGILIIDVNTNHSTSQLVNGILQGLACGTFLYVTFFEVLPHEFNKPRDRILKLLFVILGFIFVNGVLFLEMHMSKESTGCS